MEANKKKHGAFKRNTRNEKKGEKTVTRIPNPKQQGKQTEKATQETTCKERRTVIRKERGKKTEPKNETDNVNSQGVDEGKQKETWNRTRNTPKVKRNVTATARRKPKKNQPERQKRRRHQA